MNVSPVERAEDLRSVAISTYYLISKSGPQTLLSKSGIRDPTMKEVAVSIEDVRRTWFRYCHRSARLEGRKILPLTRGTPNPGSGKMSESPLVDPVDAVMGVADLMHKQVSESLRALTMAMEESSKIAWDLVHTAGEAALRRKAVNQEMVDGLRKIAESMQQAASLVGKTAWSARTAADNLRELAHGLAQAAVVSERNESTGSNRSQ